MKLCSLCFETNENYLDLNCDEFNESSIGSLLLKYFPFCFPSEPKSGIICGKCRCQVEAFNTFYIRIESIHSSLQTETIFVEALENIKVEESDNEPTIEEPYFEDNNELSDNFSTKEDPDVDESKSEERKKRKYKKSKNFTKTRKERKRTAEVKPTGPFICQMCGEKVLTENQLFRHNKLIHELQEFKCTVRRCPHSFATKEELDQHDNEIHHRDECPICKKLVQTKLMKCHQQLHHDDNKNAICDICGLVFAHKYYLNSHYSNVHEKIEGDYECDICQTKAKSKEMIRRHMKRHIEGPQACPICGKVVNCMRALRRHKSVHFAHKYVCDICGKGFHRNEKLREHSYIHTGFKNAYVCQCGRGFRFNSSYYTHRKNCLPHKMSLSNKQT